jgi:stringent starvation protein B
MISQKPYLIRAIHEWCIDSNLTPFLATVVDSHTTVPNQYVENGQIVLNLSPNATKELQIDVDWITFKATFGGLLHDVAVPVKNVIAIFAQENGQGMQFNAEVNSDSNNKQPAKDNSGLRLIK